ncbi:39S ribosomal protein L39, mitochondrial [Armadillidium nasatum]|uniref:39S ribosomal protein L39, mitochondrial n=1 Tax=Armadillidium nasatum TaxID=96803 RepID=A0A5N5SS28_9CRUS|nr:39S ribosomal protein L39, mitochondrial [Armadillidium nasatum]
MRCGCCLLKWCDCRLENKPFQRLEVDAKLALRMFEDNMYKREQIPRMAAQSESDYVDISRGPCISHTGHLGKCTITGVHPLPLDAQYGTMYRVQGVALPKDFHNSGPLPYIESFHEGEAEERTLSVCKSFVLMQTAAKRDLKRFKFNLKPNLKWNNCTTYLLK